MLDLILMYLSGLAIVGAIYVTLQLGVSKNFFNWQCLWRIIVLQGLHALCFGVIGYAIGGNAWALALLELLSLALHWLVFFLAHSGARQARRARARRSDPMPSRA